MILLVPKFSHVTQRILVHNSSYLPGEGKTPHLQRVVYEAVEAVKCVTVRGGHVSEATEGIVEERDIHVPRGIIGRGSSSRR